MTSERAVEPLSTAEETTLRSLTVDDWPPDREHFLDRLWATLDAARAATPVPREDGWEERLERIFGDMELGLGDASHVGALVNEARRVLAATRREPPEPGPAIDVERLARALTRHRTNLYSGKGPDAYLEHACMGDCCPDIAAEYDRLAP